MVNGAEIFLIAWFALGLIGVIVMWFDDSFNDVPPSEWAPIGAVIYGPLAFIGGLVSAYKTWTELRDPSDRYRFRRFITRHDKRHG